MSPLKKKIVLITGASRGLGFQIAMRLAEKNLHLIITSRTVGALESLSDKIVASGSTVTIVPLDLTKEKDFQIAARSIYERFGVIDILIHSASLAIPMAPIETIQKNELINFFQNTFMTQQVIKMIDPLLKKNPSSLALFIQDTNKYRSNKFFGIYNANRLASGEIIAAYAAERKRLGPTILTFNPKPMPTKIRSVLFPGENKDKLSTCETEAKKMVKFISSFL
tara:strand:- start:407 stop:1078 length:672 start_codon:yes stop_codon:yes gene_type:complete